MEEEIKRHESARHKEAKLFWLKLGRLLEFDVKEEDNVNDGFADIIWKKKNLFIAIEIECAVSSQSNLDFNKFENLNPRFILIECFYDSTAEKIREESKKFNFKVIILNRKLPDNYRYFTDMNKSLKAFIRFKDLREEFLQWISP